jgi:phosphate transport system protein
MDVESRPGADELQGIRSCILAMGSLADARVGAALDGLVAGDRRALADVVAGDEQLNRIQIEIDERCLRLLALFHPVAVDLRTVISALRINTDFERVGDLAVNIAEAAQRYLLHPPVKPLVDLPRMGDLARRLVRDALDAFIRLDVAVASNVLRQAAWLEVLRNQIVRELLTYMLGNPRVIEPSVHLVLMARHLERVGDHAANVAEDVIFAVEARDIRHRSGKAPDAERRRRIDNAPV